MQKRIYFITGILLVTGLAKQSQAQDNYYPDYRSKRDNFSKIHEKDIRADLATFTVAGIDESISKLPLQKVPMTSYENSKISFEGDNVKVTISTEPFDAAKHKMQFIEKYLLRIDRKGYYGNYGSTPVSSISSVLVIMGKDTVPIPPVAFRDLHNLRFGYADASGEMRSRDALYWSADKHRLYIYLLSKGDKSSYEVTWIIQDKQYLRRVLDYDLFKF